ncbi:MAB_1171c family putative transporter [Streptomyces sp. NPDC005962]|uniref:MAB_1171c family putative transporter n=1 Tax=Streptomyces sp. NPDC005962 TaxID=3154466 RepID=UPI0033F952C4
MKDILHPISLTAATLGFLFLLRDLRAGRRDTALVALAAVFLLSACSFVFAITPIWRRVDATFGTTNLSVPLSMSCVIALLVCQQIVLDHWARPAATRNRDRVWLAAGAAVVTGLVILYLCLTPAVQRPTDFSLYYVHDPFYAAYMTLYVTAYTVGEVLLARACCRLANQTSQRWVTYGLRVVALGAVVTLGYSAVRIGGVIAAPFGATLAGWEGFAWTCGDAGAMITLLGWFLPTIADQLHRAGARARMYRQHRQLRPLWLALYQVDPTIKLKPERSSLIGRLRARPISFRLYRRAVEIRDGQISIRPYLDAAVRERSERGHTAAGRNGNELHAAVTADQIRAALHAQAHDANPPRPTEYADTQIEAPASLEDVDILLAISRHYAAREHETPLEAAR